MGVELGPRFLLKQPNAHAATAASLAVIARSDSDEAIHLIVFSWIATPLCARLAMTNREPGGALDAAKPTRRLLPMRVKEAAHTAFEALADGATLQDAAERIALLATLEKGRQAVREGRWKSQEDVEKLLPSWLEK